MIEQLAFGIDLNIDPLWCAWFSGILDGEGTFNIQCNSHDLGVHTSLAIKMRDDEADGIREIYDKLHCGIVYFGAAQCIGNPYVVWRVEAISGIVNIIIPILDKYPLRMKKQHDYKIWREAVMLIHSGAHLNSNRSRVLELKRMLTEVRKYKPPAELLQQARD